MKKIKFSILYLIGIAILLSGCPSPEIILDGENTLTEITVNDGNKDMVGNIAASTITFSDSAVAGTTQVTVKAISFSDKASGNVNRNDVISLNKTLTITAENGSAKNYMMSINVSVATTTGDGMTTTGDGMTTTGDGMTTTGDGMTTTGDGMTTTDDGMTTTGNPVGTITGTRLAIAAITDSRVTLSGNLVKQNNPFITELGILVTATETLTLELTNGNEAPTRATKISATAEQLPFINSATTVIPLSFSIPTLASFTTYYFRAYAAISGGGVVYFDRINARTLARKVSVSNFNVVLSYDLYGVNSNGLFSMNYSKDPSLISSFGVLITSGTGVVLTLNGENAPSGAILITGNSTAIAAANTSVNGMFSLSASNLALETTYSYRGYVRNDKGITYTPIVSKTTPVITILIPDDNFRNAILSCINTNGMTTLSGQAGTTFGCTESFDGTITAYSNRIRTDALAAITQFNYNDYISKPDHLKIRNLNGVEQMVNLTHLNVRDNLLTGSGLDLSSNRSLTNLDIKDNFLSRLDISNNTALIDLVTRNNQMSHLDISNNTALIDLIIRNNQLSSLDISNNTALDFVDIRDNPSLTCIRSDASQLTGGMNVLAPFSVSVGTGIIKNDTQTLSVTCP